MARVGSSEEGVGAMVEALENLAVRPQLRCQLYAMSGYTDIFERTFEMLSSRPRYYPVWIPDRE